MIALGLVMLAVGQTIDVRVDPRVELLTTVFRLAGAEEFHMQGTDSRYSRDVDAYFKPFTHHSAVEMAARLREKYGIGFDAVPTLAVNLTDAEKLDERIPFDLPPARWDGRWTIKDARAFTAELKKFGQDTHYKEFLTSEQPFISHATSGLSDLLKRYDVTRWIGDFYGTRPSREPFAIVGLLCGGGNYGMSVQFPDGSLETSPIFGAYGFDAAGVPKYDETDLSTVVHEFSHAYVNALVRPDLKTLDIPAKRFMKRMGHVLAVNAYSGSEPVLYETFVRACETHMVRKYLTPELAERNIVGQRLAGFIWTSDLSDKLNEFDVNRAKYPTFATFLPQLEGEFERLSRNPEAIYRRCPKVSSLKFRKIGEDGEYVTVTVDAKFDRPMRGESRGLNLEPAGWTVAKGTAFAADNLSFQITLKLKKDVEYTLTLNRNGRGLLSQTDYPLLPYSRKVTSADL